MSSKVLTTTDRKEVIVAEAVRLGWEGDPETTTKAQLLTWINERVEKHLSGQSAESQGELKPVEPQPSTTTESPVEGGESDPDEDSPTNSDGLAGSSPDVGSDGPSMWEEYGEIVDKGDDTDGEIQEALVNAAKAKELDPDDYETWKDLGSVLDAYDDALTDNTDETVEPPIDYEEDVPPDPADHAVGSAREATMGRTDGTLWENTQDAYPTLCDLVDRAYHFIEEDGRTIPMSRSVAVTCVQETVTGDCRTTAEPTMWSLVAQPNSSTARRFRNVLRRQIAVANIGNEKGKLACSLLEEAITHLFAALRQEGRETAVPQVMRVIHETTS